jgi:hypothetical protein
VAEKLGSWNWSATNKVAMSLLSRPVEVDEKEKEDFKDVAMLHVNPQILPSLWFSHINDLVGSHRSH